jgi:hypothetical protein
MLHDLGLFIFKRLAVNILVEFLTAVNEPERHGLLSLHADQIGIWE